MKLYEIDDRLESLVDQETGEILDVDAFDSLSMEREKKIEGVALYIKNLAVLVADIKEEEDNLAARRKTAEKQIDGLKRFLSHALQGQKFQSARAVVKFKTSKSCVPDKGFVEWAQKNGRDDLLIYDKPKESRNAIKSALEAGEKIPAKIVEKIGVVVK